MISRTVDLDYSISDERGWYNYVLVIECYKTDDLDTSWTLFEMDRDGEADCIAETLDDISDQVLKSRVSECLSEAQGIIDELNCRCESCIEAMADGTHKYLTYKEGK